MWYFLYHIERSAILCIPNLNVFIVEEYFAILQLLRKCRSLERLEGIIVKESRKSDRIERKQNVKKKRREDYMEEEERTKPLWAFLHKEINASLIKKETVPFGLGTVMRHCKGMPYLKDTFLLKGEATLLFVKKTYMKFTHLKV